MKIKDSIWFTSFGMLGGCIGIVFGEDKTTGDKKAYVGKAPGFDQTNDELYISETGSKLTPEIAEKIFSFFQKQYLVWDGNGDVYFASSLPDDLGSDAIVFDLVKHMERSRDTMGEWEPVEVK